MSSRFYRIKRFPPKKGPKSMKAKVENMPGKGMWVPCRVCPCCGRFVVKLRLAEKKGESVQCYFNGWDGSPWFSPRDKVKTGLYAYGNAKLHLYRRASKWDRARKPVEPNVQSPDSLFSLE